MREKYESLALPVLKDLAKARGIKGLSTMRKAEVVERMRGMGLIDENTVICIHHFSHNGGLIHDELAQKVAPQGWLVSYDGMVVEF